MKLYRLTKAESFSFRGVSGNVYMFVKGTEQGAITLADEAGLDAYCLPQNGSILTCIDTIPKPEPKPSNVMTVRDLIPDYNPEEPKPTKVTKTPEEIEADIAVAKSKESVEDMALSLEKEKVATYLYSEALGTVSDAIDAITEFLDSEDTNLTWDQKVPYVKAFIADDPRKTLHSKVKEILDTKE